MKRALAVALAFLMLASMFGLIEGVQAESSVSAASQSADPDPIMYSSYVSGSWDSYTDNVFVDDEGYIYIVGMTFANDFPVTPGAYDTQRSGRWDVYVMKLDPLGNIVCSTLLGGNAEDHGQYIYVDDSGYIYVGGETWSTDFPTTDGAYDRTFAGYVDAYVAKFDPSLQTLIFSTLIGGTEDEHIMGLEVGVDGSAYVAGYTFSSDYPTTDNAYDGARQPSEREGFLSMISPTGSSLLYSTYIGGSNADDIRDIELGPNGNVCLLGYTLSADFPMTSGTFTGYDIFLMELNVAESRVESSTIFGGTQTDIPLDLEIDAVGCFYVTGYTFSTDFPVTTGAFDTSYAESPEGWRECFVTKIDPQGASILSSTFLGGSRNENIGSICINGKGSICVVGMTDSPDFPTTSDGYNRQLTGDGADAIVSILSPDLSRLVYSSFFGGLTDEPIQSPIGNDQANKVVSDASGNLYIVGETCSFDFPVTENAFKKTISITPSGFLMKYDPYYLSRDYTYTIANDEVTVTGYTGLGGAVTIPSTIEGLPVTSIGNSAFNNENGYLITSVVIPDSVRTIGPEAFRSNPALVSVTLGSGVQTIGDFAFASCPSLDSIIIPDSVTIIHGAAFQDCTAMTYVHIGSGVTTIGGMAFNACRSLTDIDVSPDNTVYASVDGVVYSEDLKTLVAYPAGRHGSFEIPYGVTTIGGAAMCGCPWITSLTIPDSVTTIENFGLSGTSLTSISIPDSVTTIDGYACQFSPYLTTVTIGSGVTAIGVRAFAYCPSLSSITFEGMTAPTVVGPDWVGMENPSNLIGHAYAKSDFPAPGQYFNGLLMGSNIYVPPAVAIDSPLDGSFVRTNTVTIRWSATDALSEIDHFKVKLDGGRWIEVAGNSYAFSKLKVGQHTVTVQAYGDTGLLAETSASFTLDTTAPSLRITSPLNGATVGSSLTVQWVASDPSGIAYHTVKLDGGSWVRVDGSSYTFDGLSNGKHVVKVQAVDNAGNVKEAMVKFTVKV